MPIGYNANQINMPREPMQVNQQPMQQVPQMMGQTVQPLFPQPQGNVYMINSTLEVANVPVGAGMSIALCLPENTMYIKTMQNGNPLFYPYKILPFTNETTENTTAPAQDKNEVSITDLIEKIKTQDTKISTLEEQLATLTRKKKGSDFDL